MPESAARTDEAAAPALLRANLLQARDLAAFRGERLVFEGISFQLAPGGALLLMGPNGAGKSTLLRLLAGLLAPGAGTLLWAGVPAFADRAAWAEQIAYLGHQDAVKMALSVEENLRFFARHADRPIGAALGALDLARLAPLPARFLSAGQRRRLALARLLLSAAPLWLLDEPTNGLDAAAIERLGAMLAAHRDKGGMVIAATHLPLPLAGAAELALR